MKKIKSYKNIQKIKKKKSSNNLKKIQVKTSTKILQTQYKKHIKEIINIYIKRMIKNLNEKAFKHHIYIKYYNVALNLTKKLKPKKTSNITFSKKLRISKKYLI